MSVRRQAVVNGQPRLAELPPYQTREYRVNVSGSLCCGMTHRR
jgi:hypothetical protein